MPREYFYFLSLIPPMLPVIGNLAAGPWTLLNLLVTMLFWGIDWIAPKSRRSPAKSWGAVPTIVLVLHIVLHTAGVGTLLYGVTSGHIYRGWIYAAAISTGINSGFSGINVAHELIHRRSRALRLLGLWSLMLCGYGRWMIEHVFGHHRRVATAADPATARRGENFYAFLVRTYYGQFRSALEIEARRLRRRGGRPYGIRNFVITITALELAGLAAIFLLFGPRAGGAVYLQAITAVFLLEFINYLEHYGLERRPGDPVGYEHSWQTDAVTDRILLLELVRHADHHVHAQLHYPALASRPQSPELPAGYYSLFPVALIPPLWFRIMNPVLDEFKRRRNAEHAAGGAAPEQAALHPVGNSS